MLLLGDLGRADGVACAGRDKLCVTFVLSTIPMHSLVAGKGNVDTEEACQVLKNVRSRLCRNAAPHACRDPCSRTQVRYRKYGSETSESWGCQR